MNNVEFLEDLKNILRSEFRSKCIGGFDGENLAIDYKEHMGALIIKLFGYIRRLTERLHLAREGGDEVAMKVALIEIRGFAMTLSSVFNWIVDDVETLLVTGSWPEIPEDYRFPE